MGHRRNGSTPNSRAKSAVAKQASKPKTKPKPKSKSAPKAAPKPSLNRRVQPRREARQAELSVAQRLAGLSDPELAALAESPLADDLHQRARRIWDERKHQVFRALGIRELARLAREANRGPLEREARAYFLQYADAMLDALSASDLSRLAEEAEDGELSAKARALWTAKREGTLEALRARPLAELQALWPRQTDPVVRNLVLQAAREKELEQRQGLAPKLWEKTVGELRRLEAAESDPANKETIQRVLQEKVHQQEEEERRTLAFLRSLDLEELREMSGDKHHAAIRPSILAVIGEKERQRKESLALETLARKKLGELRQMLAKARDPHRKELIGKALARAERAQKRRKQRSR